MKLIRFSSTVAPLTPAAVERGASGAVMVGMGVLKGAGCNGNAACRKGAGCGEHAGGSVGAHPIL
jgi:hypothetical protein